MFINNKSLLWRLYSFYSLSENHRWRTRRATSVNLCPFVRGVLRGILVVLATILFGFFAATVVLEPPIALILYLTHGVFTHGFFLSGNATPLIVGIAIYCLATFGAIFALGGYLYEEIKNRLPVRDEPPVDENQPASTFSLIRAYFKSVHDKICPSIDVVDPDSRLNTLDDDTDETSVRD